MTQSVACLFYVIQLVVGRAIDDIPQHYMLEIDADAVSSFALNVLQYGAKGDASTDNTKAFNDALQAAITQDHGSYVYVPSGQYLFKGTITIPTGVTLIGTYMFPPQHSAKNETIGITWNDLRDGSILGSSNNFNQSFIIMESSSAIKGFSIFYPDQDCSKQPIVYPSTILIYGAQVAILDLELINPYIGISMSSQKNSARHFIARVEGGPIKTGIYIDNCHDIGRIENVHFKSGWFCKAKGSVNKIKYYTAVHGISFVIGDTDWQYMFNTFSIGYAGGYNFVQTESGAPNGNFLGIAADACTNYSIKVDQTKQWGISITNGEFVATDVDANPPYQTATQVVISKGNVGSVHLTNCIFFGPAQYIAQIHSSSSTSFDNCEFHQWNATNPAIVSDGGEIKLIGNNFYQSNARIEFNLGTQKAIVVANSFKGTPIINADNSVQMAKTSNL